MNVAESRRSFVQAVGARKPVRYPILTKRPPPAGVGFREDTPSRQLGEQEPRGLLLLLYLIFPVLCVLLAVLALWLPLRLPWLDPPLP